MLAHLVLRNMEESLLSKKHRIMSKSDELLYSVIASFLLSMSFPTNFTHSGEICAFVRTAIRKSSLFVLTKRR